MRVVIVTLRVGACADTGAGHGGWWLKEYGGKRLSKHTVMPGPLGSIMITLSHREDTASVFKSVPLSFLG